MCFTASTTARESCAEEGEEGEEGKEGSERQNQKCYEKPSHQEIVPEHLCRRVW